MPVPCCCVPPRARPARWGGMLRRLTNPWERFWLVRDPAQPPRQDRRDDWIGLRRGGGRTHRKGREGCEAGGVAIRKSTGAAESAPLRRAVLTLRRSRPATRGPRRASPIFPRARRETRVGARHRVHPLRRRCASKRRRLPRGPSAASRDRRDPRRTNAGAGRSARWSGEELECR